MSKSNMQHQREQDDAAEIEDLAAALKLELRGELEIDSHFELTGGRDNCVIDRDNVVDVMIDLDSAAFNWAIVTQDKAILKDLKARAIKKIVADTDLMRMAAWEFKQTECAA